MNDLSTYRAAKQAKADIEAIYDRAGKELRALSGGGKMGLTPDYVKLSPEYRGKLSAFNYWHARLRQFNTAFLRQYGAEYRKERQSLNRKGASHA